MAEKSVCFGELHAVSRKKQYVSERNRYVFVSYSVILELKSSLLRLANPMKIKFPNELPVKLCVTIVFCDRSSDGGRGEKVVS